FMVPAEIQVLEALPLTVNGKVDRRRLPAPGLRASESVAPRTPAELALAEIWGQLLGGRPVGARDDFFALGGHSLLAAQVVSRARKAFGVDVPLAAIFEHPILEDLAAHISSLRGVPELPPVTRLSGGGDRALSFVQERLRFLAELEGDSAAYN